MKILFSLVTLLFIVSSTANAKIRTVSNNVSRPGQFTTFDAAQTASVAGDTIYILGSPFTYPEITVRKRLVLIGAGYMPNNQFGQPTVVAGIIFFRDAGSNDASGSVVSGFYFSGRVDLGGTLPSNDIQFFRNRFGVYINLASGSSFVTGWVFHNNIVDSYIYGGGTTRTSASAINIILANNIFTAGAYLYGFNSNSVLVDHNLFLGSSSVKLNSLFNAIISNNIFARGTGTILSNTVLCTFNNNISTLTTIGAVTDYTPATSFAGSFLGPGGGANTGNGNFVGVDPMFVNVSNVDVYGGANNYRLQTTSQGKNAATDGTDIGIYGGSYPFPSGGIGTQFDTSPMPPIPQVTSVNILNPTIQVNGTLNVRVEGRVNN